MKSLTKITPFIIVLILLSCKLTGGQDDPDPGIPFISTWNTENTGSSGSDQISLPLESGGTYDFTVYWGDGSSDDITAWDDAAVTHTYAAAGIYELSIEGTIQGFSFSNGGDRLKLTGVSQFGDLQLENSGGYFYGCENLTITATDVPDFSETATLADMFRSCTSLDSIPGLSGWDVSGITDMSRMFQDADTFDQSVGDWDISSVADMSGMFSGLMLSSVTYNDILEKWAAGTTQDNVPFDAGDSILSGSSAAAAKAVLEGRGWTVTDGMSGLFISTWNTENTGSSGSDQISLPLESGGTYDFTVYWGDGSSDDITAWDDAAVIHTYAAAGIYDVGIDGTIQGFVFNNSGDCGKLTGISQFGSLQLGNSGAYFYGCTNLVISATDVPDLTGTTDMSNAFRNCTSLADVPGIADWDVSAVLNMSGMFRDASLFNSDLTNWITSSVSNMSYMFANAAAFDGNVAGWNVSDVSTMAYMFAGAAVFDQNISGWQTASVIYMNSMFQNASDFDQPIGSWTTTSLAYVASMFRGAASFNQPLNLWNVSGVTSFATMFYGASAFDQSVGSWVISGVTSMSNMFLDSGLSDTNYGAILDGWAGQAPLLQSNVSFHAGSASCPVASESSKTLLTDTYYWTITDGDS